jgi:ABC-2 type transport system ATP-binding protein
MDKATAQNPEAAISVENVSKTFKLPHEKYSSVKSIFVNFYKRKKTYELQHALNDVTFQINKGEFFGIVGRNGSGKSTLLKLIAGIYNPTKGRFRVNGDLTPFIELGVGFNKELTGRENVYLNGALLGFSRKQMKAMYKDIVEFAELEKFMDQKLKNYSSGMQVRLAFSIAIRAQSDILLLDEVLAVGDAAFQRKCYDYFEKLKRTNTTVVLVTHDMGVVERYCDRAAFLEQGDLKLLGKPLAISAEYGKINDEAYSRSTVEEPGANKPKIQIRLLNSGNIAVSNFTSNDRMKVEMSWKSNKVENVGVAIFRQSGEYIFGSNTYLEQTPVKGKKQIIYNVELPLAEGKYFIKAGLFGSNDTIKLAFEDFGPTFVVNRDKDVSRWGGSVFLNHNWE